MQRDAYYCPYCDTWATPVVEFDTNWWDAFCRNCGALLWSEQDLAKIGVPKEDAKEALE